MLELAGQLIEQVDRDREEEDERGGDGADGDEVAAARQIAVEEGEQHEGNGRDRRDQPGLLHVYHFSWLTSSTFAVARLRKTRRMIPSARPTSAAAMMITKTAKINPRKRAPSV